MCLRKGPPSQAGMGGLSVSGFCLERSAEPYLDDSALSAQGGILCQLAQHTPELGVQFAADLEIGPRTPCDEHDGSTRPHDEGGEKFMLELTRKGATVTSWYYTHRHAEFPTTVTHARVENLFIWVVPNLVPTQTGPVLSGYERSAYIMETTVAACWMMRNARQGRHFHPVRRFHCIPSYPGLQFDSHCSRHERGLAAHLDGCTKQVIVEQFRRKVFPFKPQFGMELT